MVKPRVAILGARGMLGTDVTSEAGRNGWDIEAWDLPELDIRETSQIEKVVADSDIVVNCAAYTQVDKAEEEPDAAHKLNAEAVGNLGNLAKAEGTRVIHISTDFVFSGNLDGFYTEEDEPDPLSVYGKTKLEGEELLKQSGCSHCILRVQWTYGHAGNNFVKKILDKARKDSELRVVDDQVGAPTATSEIAAVICRLIEREVEGLFHFAADGYVSRYGASRFLLSKVGLNTAVTPCKTEDFPTPAKRPLNSRFDCRRICKELDLNIAHWREPLSGFLETL